MFGYQDEPKQSDNQPGDNAQQVVTGSDTPVVSPQNDTNYLLDAQSDDNQGGAPAVDVSPTPAAASAADTPVGGSDALQALKQQALTQLSPLMNHLEQSPEEKFRTTMMMIQAADNQDLLQTAYDAANKIEDEKARAQALLDVINEINYFSQQSK